MGHEHLRGEVAHRHILPIRQRVVGGQGRDEPFGAQPVDPKGRIARGVAQHGDIHAPFPQIDLQARAELLAEQLEAHCRTVRPHGAGQPRQQVVGGGADESHRHPPGQTCGQQSHLLLRTVDLGQDGPGPRHEGLARLRQFDAPRRAAQQLGTEFAFEPLDLLRYGGLRDHQQVGGAAETRLLGHGDE